MLPVPAAASESKLSLSQCHVPTLRVLAPKSSLGPQSLPSSAPLSFPSLFLWSVKYNYPITSHHLSTDWSIALTLEVGDEGIGASAMGHRCHLEGRVRTAAFQSNPHAPGLVIAKETQAVWEKLSFPAPAPKACLLSSRKPGAGATMKTMKSNYH